MRSDGDLVTIERSLGLKSERGISRQGNKDNPIIQDLLADIKTIALRYTDKPNTEIRASSVLEQESLELYGKYAALIWPSASEERPNWLAEPSAERYDGKYPRALHHDVPEESQILSELFHALVVEKCVKYHDNQLQKARRLNRKSEAADYEHDDAEPNGNHAAPPYAAGFVESRGGQVSSPASMPHGLPYSDDPDDELDSQDEDAFSDGSGSRTKSQRLQDYRDEIARASESYLHAADGNPDSGRKRRRKHEQDVSSKRMREISDGDAPTDSLIVQLQVNPEALLRLVGPQPEQRPDMSHRESAPRDEHRDASGNVVARGPSNGQTPPPQTLAQQVEPNQRRSSGFQAINASNDGPTAASESAAGLLPAPQVPLPSMATTQPASVAMQQAPISRRSSAANSVPLRIVPLEVSAVAEGPNRPNAPEQTNGSVAAHQPPPSQPAHTTAAIPPIVQPLTAQSPAPFRDHGHGHHAFRVHRPFVAQQEQQHQHQQSQQHPHQHQPQSQQHQPPQHQPPQHQLQHQFVARPPPGPGQQQHVAQRQVPPPQQNHQHQLMSPRQLLPASNFPPHQQQQSPPVRRLSPNQILPSNGRKNAFVEEILGDLVRCPVVAHLLAADANLDQQQLNNLKTILTNHPETRNDMEVLLTRMTSLMDPTPPKRQQQSPNLNMRMGMDIGHSLGNPGHLQRTPMPGHGPLAPHAAPMSTHTPPMASGFPRPVSTFEQSPRLKSEPMEEDKLMSASPHTGSFENVSIEINWGRQLEYSDYMEMQYCNTTKDFFDLVEAHVPDEISAEGHTIKEIRVKALKDLKGGNLLPRIVRDEGRGRAAIRHLVKRLRAQPPDSEPELMFVIVWDDK